MGRKLTQAQIERYHRDGFVYPINAFAAEEARRHRRTMEEFEAAKGRELTKGHNFKPHLLFTWVDEIVHHPAILDAVEDVIGPDIRLFHLSLWPKNAGDPAYVSWHQDATYFGLEPPLQVTAWVALTDASIEAGCMEVIPGSHKLGQLHHAEHSEAINNLLSRGQTITVEFDKSRTEFMPLRAGQLSLHHTHLAHNSRPNLSADRRIGLGLSFIPTCVRCISRTRLTAMLVRGTDRYGHFDDEPRPRVDFGAAERAAHTDAVARFRASNAEQTSRYASARDRDGPKTRSSLIPHLLELRAATDLARLQAAQGQPLEARKVLAPVYGLFTDGADMADVQDARAVLAGLDG